MKLKQDVIPLSYTPRKFISHPTNRYLYLIEGDNRVMGEEAINKRLQEFVSCPFSFKDMILILSAPARRWQDA
jgi:hypothetical protein